ncbi:hypothetical protein [Jannaschia aquimarina]|uniref:Uncharacterized protein n=1 Tax=Jannaschia aquimarina TaxID=935700 RepID=A0A0D1EMJ9_9RHOB|nr:hypothetical protein [Jannaschia aquimarina]KIT16925.1 hypothetical protein jaqu_14240 [Jannaschia aquimarina]SNT11481.1 hypothetical protein SAMN05421775_10624 [Jannaschia aquimarina]
MTKADFERDWVPYRDAILTRWPDLTDGDMQDADGSTAELAKRIAEVDDVSPAEAQRRLHEVLSGPMPADAFADPSHDNRATLKSVDYIPEGEDPLADDRRFGDDDKMANPVGRDR